MLAVACVASPQMFDDFFNVFFFNFFDDRGSRLKIIITITISLKCIKINYSQQCFFGEGSTFLLRYFAK